MKNSYSYFSVSRFLGFSVLLMMLSFKISLAQGCLGFLTDSIGGGPTVYLTTTHRGNPVEACSAHEFVYGSTDYNYWKNEYSSFLIFNDVDEEADVSNLYNCFGFAFLMYPRGWPNCIPLKLCQSEAEKFFIDGSYSKVEEFEDADLIWYSSNHCAVKPSWAGVRVMSKWYLSQLVIHPLDSNNPYAGDDKTFYAFPHDVPYDHTTLCDAMTNAKNSQVFKAYSNCSLTCNLDFHTQTKKKFEICPGVIISLDNYYIFGRIILNGTITPNNIRVFHPTHGLFGVFTTLDQALSVAQSGQTIIAEGNLTISSPVNVRPGVTLQFSTGTTITCNSTITVTGSLSLNNLTLNMAGGEIYVPYGGSCSISNCQINSISNISVEGNFTASNMTFNFSGGGFSVVSPGNITLNNCTINNASTGLYLNNRAPSISGCRFVNCGTAVSAANYSNAYLYPNLYSGGNFGIYLDATSTPICGGSSTFRYNIWDIYSNGYSSIYAQGNYWGPCPPTPSVYGNINYSNYICSDPWPNVKDLGTPSANENVFLSLKSTIKNRTLTDTDIESYKFAQLLFVSGKYDEAMAEAEYLIDKFRDSELAKSAIVLIEMCCEKTKTDSLIGRKYSEIESKYKTPKISEFIDYRRTFRMVDKGDMKEAVESFKKILKTSKDSTIIKNALYQIGNLSFTYNDDKITGKDYLLRLISEYPKDQLAKLAEIKLGITGKKLEDKSISKNESSDISMQNYPNPFNPATTIEYRINKAGLVNLKVFDILGREVQVLAGGMKESGVHKVVFDGRNHSSGTYFYRLEFTPVKGKKEVLQKSMQIVK